MTKHVTGFAGKMAIWIWAVSLLLTFGSLPAVSADYRSDVAKRIAALAEAGAVMLNSEESRTVFSHNADSRLVPASLIKILSSWIAIDLLGKEYRFQTEFYRDSRENLLVRGLGDPFLVSEEIAEIARVLKRRGVSRINRIVLDSSAFAPGIVIPGASRTLNPYDAPNGALIVNFNTLNLGRDAAGVVYSAERETPLTPLAKRKGRMIPAGNSERISLIGSPTEGLQYAGELFRHFFRDRGIVVFRSDIGREAVSPRWNLYYVHRNGKTLETILSGLLKYSNNYIANQIFLAVGALKQGYPANLTKARRVFQSAIRRKFKAEADELNFDEASGLSRDNAMTGRAMMCILERFRPYSYLLAERNGTLIKSGTLTGVYNYAGYFKTKRGLRPFVILLNQKRNSRDEILDILKRI